MPDAHFLHDRSCALINKHKDVMTRHWLHAVFLFVCVCGCGRVYTSAQGSDAFEGNAFSGSSYVQILRRRYDDELFVQSHFRASAIVCILE